MNEKIKINIFDCITWRMITFKIKNTCEKGVKEKMSEGRRTKITV